MIKKIKLLWELIWKMCFTRLCCVLPIDDNKVVFRSYHGTKYNDSPMYVSEALYDLVHNKNDIQIVWIAEKDVQIPPYAKKVISGSLRSLYELETAKIWVDNVRKDIWDHKRHGQYYIQTWHAGTTFKKVEGQVENRLSRAYVMRAKHDSKMADIFISCSQDNSQLYRSYFWYDGPILECGAPRSDIFYQQNTKCIKNVREYFGIDTDTHIILYAPTFRNSENMECYNVDWDRVISTLQKSWGGEWKVVIRLHPNLAKKQSLIMYDADRLNGSNYMDINELIVSSDLLITDYSSCAFDAMEANKKVIIYATDLDEYVQERGLYFQIDRLPFTITRSTDELCACISKFDVNKYMEDSKYFMKELGIANNDHASIEVANLILERLNLPTSKAEINEN